MKPKYKEEVILKIKIKKRVHPSFLQSNDRSIFEFHILSTAVRNLQIYMFI